MTSHCTYCTKALTHINTCIVYTVLCIHTTITYIFNYITCFCPEQHQRKKSRSLSHNIIFVCLLATDWWCSLLLEFSEAYRASNVVIAKICRECTITS